MEDPRRISKGNLKHSLTDIVFLVIAAVVSGADSWQSIEVFGKNQLDWLRKYVPLSTGIPSHDTLGRFFGFLDHQAFSKCFIDWASELSSLTKGEVVALDGKRLRGSYDRFSKKEAIHMVSCCRERAVFGASVLPGQEQRDHGHSRIVGSYSHTRQHGHY
ncbi:MAG: ISAs1 family transposase [Flavobacteriales bacterium]|nr:ISAs1 family transposase [Flavobacteriales bacterium]